MKRTNKELKRTYGKLDVDKLEDMQDEMLDLIDQSNEIQDALGRSYDVPDDISEDELDAELDALGQEEEANQQDVGEALPSYLTDTNLGEMEEPPNFVDDDKEKDKDKKEMVAQ